jgi:transposase-like protein
MKEKTESEYVKRTQRDYSYSFKLQVVQEVERGEIGIKAAQMKYGIQGNATISIWLRKYGKFDWYNQSASMMPKSPGQKMMELEEKVKLLEKQKARLEYQLSQSDKKAILFDMMIELAEKEYNIPIRKNSSPEQLINSKKNTKKA